MEIRLFRYFLTVVREEGINRVGVDKSVAAFLHQSYKRQGNY